MKKIGFVITLICLAFVLKAQKKFSEGEVEKLTKINILMPGIAYEHPLSKKFTLYAELFSSLRLRFSTSSNALGGSTSNLSLFFLPSFTGQLRYYYNGEKRLENNKRVEKNSMNYIAAINLFTAGNNKKFLTPEFQTAFVWGLHRNMPKRLSVDFNVGPSIVIPTSNNSYYYTNARTYFTLYTDLKIGVWLNRK